MSERTTGRAVTVASGASGASGASREGAHGDDPLVRYVARGEEIERLGRELSQGEGDAGRGVGERGARRVAATGALLVGVGDVLRRTGALRGVPNGGLEGGERGLSGLRGDDVAGWLATVRVEAIERSLQRALDEAFEAGLSDTIDERQHHAGVAFEGLAARDRVESACVAIERWLASGGQLERVHRDRFAALRGQIDALDARLAAAARVLVALNDERRGERDLLDDGARGRAWWFVARSECDGMAAVFAGQGGGERAGEHCAACARDAAVAARVDVPPRRHPTAEELEAFEAGAPSDHALSWVRAHVEGCASCQQALEALDDAERCIEAEVGGRPSQVPSSRFAVERGAEVICETPRFRVTSARDGKRVGVRVEPLDGALLRGGVLIASDGARVRARVVVGGLSFVLSPRARGGARSVAKIEIELDAERVEVRLPGEA